MMQKHTKTLIFVAVVSLLIIRQPVVSADSLDLIEWHESVKTDAIFAWKITTVDFVNDSMEGFLNDSLFK